MAGSSIFSPDREEPDDLVCEAQAAHTALHEPLADLAVDGPGLRYRKVNSATNYRFQSWSQIRIWPLLTEEDERHSLQEGQVAPESAQKALSWAAFEAGSFQQGVSQVLGHDRELPRDRLSDIDKAEMDSQDLGTAVACPGGGSLTQA